MMSDEETSQECSQVWPPAPTGQTLSPPPLLPQPINVRVLGIAAGVGTLGGVIDVFRIDTLVIYGFAVVAVVLGSLQPKAALISALVITLCYFFCHVAAICVGIKPPYVEDDVFDALACLIVFFPICTGAACGALAKRLWNLGTAKLGALRK